MTPTRFVLTLRQCFIGGRRYRAGSFVRCLAAEARMLVADGLVVDALDTALTNRWRDGPIAQRYSNQRR